MTFEHPIRGIRIVAPSTVVTGEPFSAGIKMLTDPYVVDWNCFTLIPATVGRYNHNGRNAQYMDNVPPEHTGRLTLSGGEGYDGPQALSFEGETGIYAGDRRPIRRLEGLRFDAPGLHYLTALDPETGVSGISNPIEVLDEPPAERLYWGDIHCQTYLTDGLRCPEELCSFARDEAFLDVFSPSEHTTWLTPRQWEYLVGVTNDYNEAHRFVTLVGLEWTSHRLGHRNVYYPGDDGPFLWTHPRDDDRTHLEELYRVAREHGALVIPHHSANAQMGTDWTLGHDSEVERLVEIYSCWGNSERPGPAGNPRFINCHDGEVPGQHVQDALQIGRQYGFVGGGDIHDGRPGDELHMFQKGAYPFPFWHRHRHTEGLQDVSVWDHRRVQDGDAQEHTCLRHREVDVTLVSA